MEYLVVLLGLGKDLMLMGMEGQEGPNHEPRFLAGGAGVAGGAIYGGGATQAQA